VVDSVAGTISRTDDGLDRLLTETTPERHGDLHLRRRGPAGQPGGAGPGYVYGQGRVARDERQIMPDPGVEFFVVRCALYMGAVVSAESPVFAGVRLGDPVDPATGLFVYEKTDLVVPDVIPIVITRKYRQLDGTIRPFGLGGSHDYQMYLAGDQATFSYAELMLGDGSRIRYDRTSGGTGYTDAIMEHTATPTGFFKSRLSWDATRAAGRSCSGTGRSTGS
jgi:hypothetical protein